MHPQARTQTHTHTHARKHARTYACRHGVIRYYTLTPLETARGVRACWQLLVVGGYNGRPLKTVEALDMDTGSWETAPALRHARTDFALAAMGDGCVVVAGGGTESCELLRPHALEWDALVPLPSRRDCCRGGVLRPPPTLATLPGSVKLTCGVRFTGLQVYRSAGPARLRQLPCQVQ